MTNINSHGSCCYSCTDASEQPMASAVSALHR